MQLGYVILYVPDVRGHGRFLRRRRFRLELRFIHDSGHYAEMETGATALAFANEKFTPTKGLFTANRPGHQAAGAEIALRERRRGAEFRARRQYGAKIVLLPVRKPWGQTVCYVKDNNGFLVEICSVMIKKVDGAGPSERLREPATVGFFFEKGMWPLFGRPSSRGGTVPAN